MKKRSSRRLGGVGEASIHVRKLATGALLCALAVVIMYLGCIIEVLDLSATALASLLCVFAVVELGGAFPWMIYVTSSILAIILLPNKAPAVYYAAFAGYYPMIKNIFERRLPQIASVLAKFACFNIALLACALILKFVLGIPDETQTLAIILVVAANVTFVLYDVLITRFVMIYVIKLKPRMHMIFKNK